MCTRELFCLKLAEDTFTCCVTDSVILTAEPNKHTCTLHHISCFCFGANLSVNSLDVSIIKHKLQRQKRGVTVTRGVG